MPRWLSLQKVKLNVSRRRYIGRSVNTVDSEMFVKQHFGIMILVVVLMVVGKVVSIKFRVRSGGSCLCISNDSLVFNEKLK